MSRGRVKYKTLQQEPPTGLQIGDLLLPAEQVAETVDFRRIFGNDQPVEVEIGSGKGTYLMRRCAARPEVNLLGIEWLKAYACYAADRAVRAGLTNVRLLCADAEQVFIRHLADGCLARVHIYFPDPWPKRRHHRRRLIKPEFLAQVRRVLLPAGEVRVVTDHDEYFEHIQQAFSAAPGLTVVPFSPEELPDGQTVGTNYERKMTGPDTPPHAIAAVREEALGTGH
jgi:tRNA (guanine-N7-)-methyltransferase